MVLPQPERLWIPLKTVMHAWLFAVQDRKHEKPVHDEYPQTPCKLNQFFERSASVHMRSIVLHHPFPVLNIQ